MAGVSTRDVGRGPRGRLVAAAVRLLEEGGPEALRARRLASEVGASTMAVYTHFGGMGKLVGAVAREGFARFSRELAAVPETGDPVADLFGIALAYRDFAVANPQLYRVMHGLAAPGGLRLAPIGLDEVMNSGRYPEGREAFGCACRAVTRVIEAGDGTGEDPMEATSQLWSTAHGYVLLEIGGYFGDSDAGLENVMLPLAVKLFAGLGHSRESVRRSALRAVAARAAR